MAAPVISRAPSLHRTATARPRPSGSIIPAPSTPGSASRSGIQSGPRRWRPMSTERGVGHVGGDGAHEDGVGPHAGPDVLHRDGPHQLDDRRLGRAVGAGPGDDLDPGEGRDRHDGAVLLRLHGGPHRPAHVEDAVEGQVHDRAPFGVGHLLDPPQRVELLAGVVDEGVDAPEALHRLGDGRLTVGRATDVAAHEVKPTPGGVDLLGDVGAQIGPPGHPDDRRPPPRLREQTRDCVHSLIRGPL